MVGFEIVVVASQTGRFLVHVIATVLVDDVINVTIPRYLLYALFGSRYNFHSVR